MNLLSSLRGFAVVARSQERRATLTAVVGAIGTGGGGTVGRVDPVSLVEGAHEDQYVYN